MGAAQLQPEQDSLLGPSNPNLPGWLRSFNLAFEQSLLERLESYLHRQAPLLFEEAHRFNRASGTCSAPQTDEPQVYAVIVAPKYDSLSLQGIIGPENDAKLMIRTFERRGVTQARIHAFTQDVDRSSVIGDGRRNFVPEAARSGRLLFQRPRRDVR
jgi:hypothetical protein